MSLLSYWSMATSLSVAILLLLFGLNHGQTSDLTQTTIFEPTTYRPVTSQATTENNNYVCIPEIDRFCYLQEAIQFIFSGQNRTDFDLNALLDIPPDSESLDWFLLLGLQQLAVFMNDNPDLKPGDFNFILQDLFRMVELLANEGSTAVTWYDLKYYIKRFVTPEYVLKLLAFYQFREVPARARLYIETVYLGQIKTQKCQEAMNLWFDSIDEPTKNTWALRIIDASGKPPANLLAANTHWLGNWKSCHKVKYANQTQDLDFKGRYCRAKVRANPMLLGLAGNALEGFPGNPEELAAVDIGLCVPDYCEEQDIASVVNNTLKLMTIQQFAFIRSVDGISCESPAKPNAAYYITLVLITILATIVILATLYDCFYRTILNKSFASMSSLSIRNVHTLCNFASSTERPNPIYHKNLNAYQYQFSNRLQLHGMSYPSEVDRKSVQQKRKHWYDQFSYRFHRIAIDLSAYTAILKPMSNSGTMQCLNGLRVISMLWIVWGHTYNYIGDQSYFLLISNALDLLDIQKERIDPQIIINALYGVDTFFVISAMLITLSMMRMLKKSGMPRWYFWPMMYLERYLRLIPPYIMIFLLYIYVVPYIGQGPLWTAKDFPMKNEDCHNYWWAYFLLINNFVPNGRGTRCMGYYWYVSNDFQLFLISPFLIVPLYYYPLIGCGILLGVLLASTSILMFNVANTYVKGQILVTLQAIWEDTYIKPYCRAGPYVFGIILGYILFKTDKKKIHLHPLYHLFFWALTIVFMLTAILGNWTNHQAGADPMSPGVYAMYFAFSRMAWPLAIAWIIFACYKGLAPLVDSILSWRRFTFFAHISYTTYLIHPMIMVYYMFAQQSLFHATDITLIYIFLGHLFFALILGFVSHLVFERTFGVLINLLLPKRQR